MGVRLEGRSIVVLDEDKATNVRSIFDLYAYHNCTLDEIVRRLADAGIKYSDAAPGWCRSKIHNILRDRAYIGEVRYKGQWFPGSQKAIVDRNIWNRVQSLMGDKSYKSNELIYAGGLIRCAHCGNLITGESVVKKSTGKEYIYYRCTMYKTPGHPNVRLTEAKLDAQVLAALKSIRQDDAIRDWFTSRLRLWAQDQQRQSREGSEQIQRDMTLLREQQDRLLNLRLLGEIEADTFARKSTELRDRIATLTLQLEAAARSRDELADLAMKVFELSQALADRWLSAEYAEKRYYLKMVFSNFSLNGVSLGFAMNKPFGTLAKGLSVLSSRGDKI